MNSSEIVVIYQQPGNKATFQKIKNNMCELEKMVGGEIAEIPYKDIVIVCQKDSKDLRPNIYINRKFLSIGETIRGNIIMLCKENNNFKTLSKEQVIKYLEFLKNASFNYNNVDENRKIILSNDKKSLKNIEREIGSEKYEDNNNKSEKIDNDKVLKMILSIQTIILKFIKDNES